MKIVFRIILLFVIEFSLSSDVPRQRAVLFPNDIEENSEEFIYGKVHSEATLKPSSMKHQNPQETKFRIDSTELPCENTIMSFCEDATNKAYPTKYVESILANTDAQKYENYFNRTVTNDDLLDFRLSNDETIELCNSFKRHIYPQLAMNVENEWRFVINQNNYRQPIRLEICQKKKSKCLFTDSLPNNLVAFCIQKYTKVPLLSLGENGDMISYDYEFPSHCQCKIQRLKQGLKPERNGGKRRSNT